MEKSFHCRLYLLDVPQISCQARGQFVKSGISWLHSSIFFICKICHILDLGSSCVYTAIIRPILLHPEQLCYISAHIQCTKTLWIACVANMCVCVSSPYLLFNRTHSRTALVFMSIYRAAFSVKSQIFLSELVFVFLSVHTSSRLVHAPLICCSIISPALSQNFDSKMMFTFLGCCHVDKISTLFLLSQSILTHCGRLSCWYADLVSRSSQPSSSLSYLSVYHHHCHHQCHHHHHHHNYPCPLCMPVTRECWSCLRSTHHHNTFNIHSTDFSTYRVYNDFSIRFLWICL